MIKVLSNAQQSTQNVTKQEKSALKDLATEESIMILPADKGKCTVILDKEEYVNKINTMLSDTRTYKKLIRDLTQDTKKKLIKKLTKLKTDGKITQNQYDYLYPTTEVTPRFYGTPKIHKPSNQLHP